MFGSTVEYFDFTLFAGASALIFNRLMFSSLGPTGALLASFATFGVAYVARPIGAIVFGTLGDKIGRKRTLVLSLNLMGVSTFLVGLMPTYAMIGLAAPIILIALRLVQGFSAGGEQAGSNSLSMEHAPQNRRGLYASWTMQGTTLGSLLGVVAFIAITSLPEDAMLSWGWRVPFLLAAPLMLVAFWIRQRVDETDAFLQTKKSGTVAKAPITEVIVHHWPAIVRVIFCSLLAVSGSVLNVYALAYVAGHTDMAVNSYLIAALLAGVVGLIVQPFWARLSDRIGRKPVFAGSMLLTGILFFPFFVVLSTGRFVPVLLMAAVVGVAAVGANGTGAAFYSEMFPTRVRYIGMALGTQLGFIVAGFAPAIMTAIDASTDGWFMVALFAAVCMFLAAGSSLTARESNRTTLDKLGEKDAVGTAGHRTGTPETALN
ncbi:MAG: MHS family MFS transporter [Pseudonocardia sp.]|nr:MHS family MFS transporter [Pseudonocardia sp.]